MDQWINESIDGILNKMMDDDGRDESLMNKIRNKIRNKIMNKIRRAQRGID